jgi:hypothetical protein
MTKQADEQVAHLTEQIGALTMRLRESEEAARKATIDRKVEGIKLPAAREHFRALYSAAMVDDAPRTVAFSSQGTTKQVAPADVLDSLVTYLNGNVSKLLTELSKSGSPSRDGAPLDDAGAEVDRLAKAKMKAEKLSYAEAYKTVLSDPDNAALKEAYAMRGA